MDKDCNCFNFFSVRPLYLSWGSFHDTSTNSSVVRLIFVETLTNTTKTDILCEKGEYRTKSDILCKKGEYGTKSGILCDKDEYRTNCNIVCESVSMEPKLIFFGRRVCETRSSTLCDTGE